MLGWIWQATGIMRLGHALLKLIFLLPGTNTPFQEASESVGLVIGNTIIL